MSSGYSDRSCDHLRLPDRHRVLCASAATPVPAVIIEFSRPTGRHLQNRCPTGMGRDPRLRDPVIRHVVAAVTSFQAAPTAAAAALCFLTWPQSPWVI